MTIPTIQLGPSDMPAAPALTRLAMFTAAFRLQNIEAGADAFEELEHIYTSGDSLWKKVQMLRASAVPSVLQISSAWQSTMLLTAMKIQAAHTRSQWMASIYPRQAEFFPYLRVSLVTDDCKRSPHAWLDGFAAKWDDEVWRLLRPPFGWECACMVQTVSRGQVPWGLEPLQPGMQRVPGDVITEATGWLAKNPAYLWDRSFVPKHPHVPAETWLDDPERLKPAPDECAILKRFGISVTTIHIEDSGLGHS